MSKRPAPPNNEVLVARRQAMQARLQQQLQRLTALPRPARPALFLPSQIKERSQLQATQKHRRRDLLLLLIIALLLLLLFRCECETPPVPEAPICEQTVCGEAAPRLPVVTKSKFKKQPLGQVRSQKRPTLEAPAQAPPKWLAAFRFQVQAKAPELSACFNGSERPGALLWKTTVMPREGTVFDHELEAVLSPSALTTAQHDCVLRILTVHPYKLPVPEDEPNTIGRRTSLLLEF